MNTLSREPAHIRMPLMDAYQELGAQVEAMQAQVLEVRMATAAEIIASPEYQAKLKAMLEDQVIATLRQASFVKEIESLVTKAITDIAVDVLGERLKEAEGKIASIVERDWDTRVTKVAHEMLDQKLAELRRKIL